MLKKILKSAFLPTIFIAFFLWLSPGAKAVNYSVQDVELFRQGKVLVSEPIVDRQAFNAVAVQATSDPHGLMVNFGDGWKKADISDSEDGYSELLMTSPTHSVQFRLEGEKPADLKLKATLFYYDAALDKKIPAELQASTEMTARSFKIISRAEWGADESLRVWTPQKVTPTETGEKEKPAADPCADLEKTYPDEFETTGTVSYDKDGEPYTWPVSYAKSIKKIIVHHTDSEIHDLNGDEITDTRDYQAMIRAIYYYHTVTRGWGDIGYNYLIDPLGNIYEGRYGGDKVIGAHALCNNDETIGIAVIGNYQTDDVPEPAMQALIWLIGTKAKQFNIDPEGSSMFHGKSLLNVLGHRDVRATTCPGDVLYGDLPKIRDRAALFMKSFSESGLSVSDYDYNAEFAGEPEMISLGPGERKSVTLQFRNTGKKAWNSDTWMHVALNDDPNARVVPIVQDKNFVAADLQETSVPSGGTGTFVVDVEAGFKPGHYSFEVSPVVNGRYKISRASVYLSLQVMDPAYSYEVAAHQFPMGTVFQGQKLQGTLDLKNTGNVTWRNYGDNAIALGTADPKDHASIFVKDNPSRIGYMVDSQVAPGGTAHFVMNLTVPEGKTGEVIERFVPVIEKVGWLEDKSLGFRVIVKKPVHLAKTVKVDNLTSMLPGERRFIEVDMTNQGDLPWDSSTVQTTLLGRGLKVFKRLVVPEEPVKPGETMKIGFWVEAPIQAGNYSVYLRSSFNGKDIRGAYAQYMVNVPKPVMRGALLDQGAVVLNIHPKLESELTVKFKNTGNVVWRKMGPTAVHLGSSMPFDRQSKLYVKSDWLDPFRPAGLEEDEVMPGNTGTFKFKVSSDAAGQSDENFQLVMENVGWIPGASVQWRINISGTPAYSPGASASLVSIPSASTLTANQTGNISNSGTFRVRLSYGSDTATLTADKDFVVTNGSNQALLSLASGKSFTVTRVDNTFQVAAGTISKTATIVRLVPKDPDGISEIVSMERRPSWDQTLNDNRFRGVIEMRVIDKQAVYINELPLEDYLKGLGEVSNSDPTEKLKTIAVLARTYARYYMSDDNRKFPGMPYDGSDDPAIFQKYLGYGLELRSPNFVKAVSDTENMVVTYNGKLIKTPYFNQSDGRTRSAQEVWGWTDTPYLISVPDPWCKGLELKGHGVGLSGCGATAQANEGKTYDQIIKYYYTGVDVKKMSF